MCYPLHVEPVTNRFRVPLPKRYYVRSRRHGDSHSDSTITVFYSFYRKSVQVYCYLLSCMKYLPWLPFRLSRRFCVFLKLKDLACSMDEIGNWCLCGRCLRYLCPRFGVPLLCPSRCIDSRADGLHFQCDANRLCHVRNFFPCHKSPGRPRKGENHQGRTRLFGLIWH